jgi:hypothetical protein
MNNSELSKVTQLSLTNKAIAARLSVMRAYSSAKLSELERLDLKIAADRLSMLEDPSINEVHAYFKSQEAPFESPIDNEL